MVSCFGMGLTRIMGTPAQSASLTVRPPGLVISTDARAMSSSRLSTKPLTFRERPPPAVTFSRSARRSLFRPVTTVTSMGWPDLERAARMSRARMFGMLLATKRKVSRFFEKLRPSRFREANFRETGIPVMEIFSLGTPRARSPRRTRSPEMKYLSTWSFTHMRRRPKSVITV